MFRGGRWAGLGGVGLTATASGDEGKVEMLVQERPRAYVFSQEKTPEKTMRSSRFVRDRVATKKDSHKATDSNVQNVQRGGGLTMRYGVREPCRTDGCWSWKVT